MTTKRLFLVQGVLLACATGAAAYILAVMYSNPNPARATFSNLNPTPTAAVMLTPSKTPKIRTLSGIIRSVGPQKLVISLQHGGTTATVAVDNATTYASSRGPLPFTALKVGQLVEVEGRVSNGPEPLTLSALRITLLP